MGFGGNGMFFWGGRSTVSQLGTSVRVCDPSAIGASQALSDSLRQP